MKTEYFNRSTLGSPCNMAVAALATVHLQVYATFGGGKPYDLKPNVWQTAFEPNAPYPFTYEKQRTRAQSCCEITAKGTLSIWYVINNILYIYTK